MLEESELIAKNIRGRAAQNLFRMCHAGRNKKVRVLMITTDLALIDSSFIRLCLQRYHGRLGIEQNSKTKFKSYYGSQWLEQTMKLRLGEFLYLNDTELKVVQSENWQPKTKPTDYNDSEDYGYITIQPQKPSLWKRILGW